jgi:hypothetical protein
MPTPILDTVTEYENKALELATNLQGPVVDFVGKVAETVAARLPENRPELPVAPGDVVETQFAFAGKVLKAQHDFAKALVAAVAPIIGAAPQPAVKKTVKAA